MYQALAYWLTLQGSADAAVAVIVAQAAFLRPRELILLLWRDFILPDDACIKGAGPNTGAVVVRQGKQQNRESLS